MTEEKVNSLRAVGTTSINWKYTKRRLTISDLTGFVLLTNKRDIRKGNVTKLKNLLVSGKHFETPLLCNAKDEQLRLIDGNHRLLALERFFADYPNRAVEVGICYYEDLTEDEEKEMFTSWNLGTRQTFTDFVTQYWDNIWIAPKLHKPAFPCNIRPAWTNSAMEYKQLIYPFLCARHAAKKEGWLSCLKAMDFVQMSMELEKADLVLLHQFMEEYIDLFGKPDKTNTMYRKSVFMCIAHIWFNNYELITPEVMKKRLKKLLGTERAIFWGTQGAARTHLVQCRRDFVEILNSGLKTPIFF